MMRVPLAIALLAVAGCSGNSSNSNDLQDAANQSTPEAAQVLNGAAENGMDPQAALNEAAEAQASNSAQNQDAPPPTDGQAQTNSQ